MAIYEITAEQLRRIKEGDFHSSGFKERADLQRLLRTQISAIAEDLYVLSEEFSEWEDSKRRIDLLALSKDANLVVVELKRTQHGDHMELQALRYAAMVSKMTFERAVQVNADFLQRIGEDASAAQSRILQFLGWTEAGEDTFAAETWIILVAPSFGKELTTSVMWLNEHQLNIKCVEMKPHKDGDRTLIEVRQVIPLPEATDYQIKLREKETEDRTQRSKQRDLKQQFWDGVVSWSKKKGGRHGSLKTGSYTWISAGSGIGGLGWNLAVNQQISKAELYIDRGDRDENKAIFDQLFKHRSKIEATFPYQLEWQRLDDRRASRIKTTIQGGYRNPESEWPSIHEAMVERMAALEKVLQPFLAGLTIK